jgi:hypothetical protein
LLAHLHEEAEQFTEIKKEVGRPKRKEADKKQLVNLLTVADRKGNFLQNLLIQSICHQDLIKQWLDKALSRLSHELASVSQAMTEIRDIVEVGESAKESLFLYLSSNLPVLQAKFPALKMNIKQTKVDFAQLQQIRDGSR